MSHKYLLKRRLKSAWHPCTQMKQQEAHSIEAKVSGFMTSKTDPISTPFVLYIVSRKWICWQWDADA